ncbi:MAG TPA: NADAR family protein [Ktedonobacteraceae bacterium]|nr:NADAR family protein [Ktedonobacteraceae bacterium]
MPISFYTPHEEPYGCFSNFSRHGIEIDGVWWPTVEHYFQAQKFAGTAYVAQIQRALTPQKAAEMGRNRACVKADACAEYTPSLIIVYHVLSRHTSSQDLGANYFDERDRQATQNRYVKGLQWLGFEVALQPTVQVA